MVVFDANSIGSPERASLVRDLPARGARRVAKSSGISQVASNTTTSAAAPGVVRVRIDKAGADYLSVGVDDLFGAVFDGATCANFGDAAVQYRHVRVTPGRTGAVCHGSVFDQQVVGHGVR